MAYLQYGVFDGFFESPPPLAPMVQPWCNLGRNNGHNRHNGQLTPHICYCVDIIDTIDRVDKEVHNFESVGWGFESLRVR